MKIEDKAYLEAALEIFCSMFKKELIDARRLDELEKAAKHVALIAKTLKAELSEGQDCG